MYILGSNKTPLMDGYMIGAGDVFLAIAVYFAYKKKGGLMYTFMGIGIALIVIDHVLRKIA
jgi:hypothetical protein